LLLGEQFKKIYKLVLFLLGVKMSNRIGSTRKGKNPNALCLEIKLEHIGERPIFDAYNEYIQFLKDRDKHFHESTGIFMNSVVTTSLIEQTFLDMLRALKDTNLYLYEKYHGAYVRSVREHTYHSGKSVNESKANARK